MHARFGGSLSSPLEVFFRHAVVPGEGSSGSVRGEQFPVFVGVAMMPSACLFDQDHDHLAGFGFDGWRVDLDSESHSIRPMSPRMKSTNKAWSSNRPEAFQLLFIGSPFAPVRSL